MYVAASCIMIPVGRGRAGYNRLDHDQQHRYHHAPTVKPEAATGVFELMMMGVRTPETCWAVHKTSSNKLEKLLHLVGWFIWIVGWCTDLQTLNLKKVHKCIYVDLYFNKPLKNPFTIMINVLTLSFLWFRKSRENAIGLTWVAAQKDWGTLL
jgi:hypothetical protein